ncbi:MAG: triose-phosphate isomerase, partial [Candidatus Thermoplasmatota archaeon]|nr:triose-phosphate isomerase [Candidatus Thermoplasmatota archaeon]
MDKPLIVVNFKTYETAMGDTALTLAKAMDDFTDRDFRMIAVVSAFDLSSISNSVSSVEVWSQHLDPVGKGSHTGWLEPDLALHHGAVGTIINHAEHKVNIEHIEKLMVMLPSDFPICACAADVDEAIALAKLGPTFIA